MAAMKRSPACPIAAAILAASLSAGAQTPPVPPPPPVNPPASPANAAEWTRVHIVTQTPGVVLERRVGSLSTDPRPSIYDSEPHWDRVCAAPCDAAAPLGAQYRIGGEGVTTSGPFALHGPSMELRVDGGSSTARRVGSYFAIIGFVAAAAGGAFLAVAALKPADSSHPSTGLGGGGIASIVALATGGVMGITGIGLIAGNGTSVRDESRKELARLAPPSILHATFRF
jgi:hypothetical protein